MAAQMDDSGLRQRGVDQSGVQEIGGHLVDDPQRPGGQRRKALEIVAGHSRYEARTVAAVGPVRLQSVESAVPELHLPAPNTAGCEARICSVSEVPDLGMPMTKTGSSEAEAPSSRWLTNAASNALMIRSTR